MRPASVYDCSRLWVHKRDGHCSNNDCSCNLKAVSADDTPTGCKHNDEGIAMLLPTTALSLLRASCHVCICCTSSTRSLLTASSPASAWPAAECCCDLGTQR